MGNPFTRHFVDLALSEEHKNFKGTPFEQKVSENLKKYNENKHTKKGFKYFLAHAKASLNVVSSVEIDASSSGLSILNLMVGNIKACVATNLFFIKKNGVPIKANDLYQILLVALKDQADTYFINAINNSFKNRLKKKSSKKPLLEGSKVERVPYEFTHAEAEVCYKHLVEYMDRATIKGFAMKAAYNQGHTTRVKDLKTDFLMVCADKNYAYETILFAVNAVCNLF